MKFLDLSPVLLFSEWLVFLSRSVVPFYEWLGGWKIPEPPTLAIRCLAIFAAVLGWLGQFT
jgi:hypothetical protein